MPLVAPPPKALCFRLIEPRVNRDLNVVEHAEDQMAELVINRGGFIGFRYGLAVVVERQLALPRVSRLFVGAERLSTAKLRGQETRLLQVSKL